MTTIKDKPLCAICNIERGIFVCNGCSQSFCLQHTTNHYNDIADQFTVLEQTRDQVLQDLNYEMVKPQGDIRALHDDLASKIDIWEQESISKIKKAAIQARTDLFKCTIGHLSSKRLDLEQITNELQQARKRQDFIETDLSEWQNKLKQLKEELTTQPNVIVHEDSTKLISNIHINVFDGKELFNSSAGDAVFEENGKVVCVKANPNMYSEVRGKCEYTIGEHRILLKIEELNGWTLFGIISKSTPLQVHSYASPSCYGWYNGSNYNYAAGQRINGQGTTAQKNDTIQLVINCDKKLIRFINEQKNEVLELNVDTDKCPFPWQLHLNLNLPTTRIRIIS
ncbi:unnamed protein product [Adineta steineri]|uniref:B30.2/SPRY domain-containing protein n=1 Tax=Adineta steineri TaxID=433720 RepID=A0A819PPE3_9BILA|nr:unnamed protein product [Adineta steineri]